MIIKLGNDWGTIIAVCMEASAHSDVNYEVFLCRS